MHNNPDLLFLIAQERLEALRQARPAPLPPNVSQPHPVRIGLAYWLRTLADRLDPCPTSRSVRSGLRAAR